MIPKRAQRFKAFAGRRIGARCAPLWLQSAREFAGRLQDAGWADVGWRNLTGGIVALHRATKPS